MTFKRSPKETPSPLAQPELPPATITEYKGVRFLHLGTEWIQGAMRLRSPYAIELEYVQQMMMWMLFNDQPQHIVQLGMGAGALTKFCYRHFPDARVTTIELNPAVIDICAAQFELPPNDARLHVVEMDALDFVMDAANHGTVDALQVDLYDAEARGPVLDTPEFYQACADSLTAEGMMTVNVFGDYPTYKKNIQTMEQVFDAVVWLPAIDDDNVIVIAFKQAPVIDFSILQTRASAIRRKTGMPAKSWVTGMKAWMMEAE